MRVLFIYLSCAIACACADDRATGPDFSGYPQTPWRHSDDAQLFRGYLAWQRGCRPWQTNAAEYVERMLARPSDSKDAQLFRVQLSWQTKATEHVERILATSEFGYPFPDTLESYLSAYQYEIIGRQEMRLISYSPSTSDELSETQLAAVIAAIGELPHTNALPPIEHLLLVSFQQGTNWVTHSYDRRAPPKAMEKIFQVRRVLWERNFTVR
jgi:hypothetical protein